MKRKFYLISTVISLCVGVIFDGYTQGCVAVKNMSSCSMNWGEDAKGLALSLNYRYFRSYKHFVGKHEETQRVQQGTEVINNDNSINLGVAYTFNQRWSASVIIPFIYIDRSSMYEHLGNSSPANPNANNPNFLRFHTQSQGLGDVRAIAYYNAIKNYHHGNLTLGAGFKLPTGDYNAKDYFHKPEGLVEGVVDQSMQLGDGGFGTIVQFDFNHNLAGNFFGYASAMYMVNPRNTNGVQRSQNLTRTGAGQEIPLSNEFSVPDQYMIRAGGQYSTHGIQASLGGRMECIPSRDLIGQSDGFRRPGYIISVEPAVSYMTGPHTIGFNFPIALERNRTRSQIDIARGVNPATGVPYHGDAAFADWLVSITYSYKLPGRGAE